MWTGLRIRAWKGSHKVLIALASLVSGSIGVTKDEHDSLFIDGGVTLVVDV
jgi:hypothetical protein